MTSLSVDNPDFRCAVWTTAQGIDPVGSALRLDRLVLVEVPQPWPNDVGSLEWFTHLDLPPGTQLQTIVPESGRTDGDVVITRWERPPTTSSATPARLQGLDWHVPAEHVPAALAIIVTGAMPDPGSPAGAAQPADNDVLVCAHGTRDRCCGGPGTRLAIEARAAMPNARIRRTSHIGGHRFAPTAMTLPDGRMWAYLDVAALAGIVDRSLPAAEAREFYRGTTALDPWAQVVEAELLTHDGWAGLDLDTVAATITPAADGLSAAVDVAWTGVLGADTRSAEVHIAQRYPVLVCGLDPSAAKKSAVEFRIAD